MLVLEREKDGLKAIIASLHCDKEQLHQDMQTSHAYMQELEDKLYQSNRNCLSLLKKMRE